MRLELIFIAASKNLKCKYLLKYSSVCNFLLGITSYYLYLPYIFLAQPWEITLFGFPHLFDYYPFTLISKSAILSPLLAAEDNLYLELTIFDIWTLYLGLINRPYISLDHKSTPLALLGNSTIFNFALIFILFYFIFKST